MHAFRERPRGAFDQSGTRESTWVKGRILDVIRTLLQVHGTAQRKRNLLQFLMGT